MSASNLIRIALHWRESLFGEPEWTGTPDADDAVFTIGGRYVIRFLELRITIAAQSIRGPDKPILSMQYHASQVSGGAWPADGMIPYGQWYYDGRDDLGTEYEYQQGASGYLDRERSIFDSDISFEPDVPVSARWIEVRFMDRSNLAEPVRTFRAAVPPLSEWMDA